MNKHKEGNNKQKKRKFNDNIFSRKSIETLLLETTDEQLIQHFKISQIVSKMFVSVDNILCSHSSIFIGGINIIKIIELFINNNIGIIIGITLNFLHSFLISGCYNKFSRKLSQTPWFINGEKKVETSVQDLLCNLIAETTKAECMIWLYLYCYRICFYFQQNYKVFIFAQQ